MPRFVIERDIPEIGSSEREQLRGAAAASNDVLVAMRSEGKNISWEQSYVVQDKTFCIYHADESGLIDEPAERSGFPASIVTEVKARIDPITAES